MAALNKDKFENIRVVLINTTHPGNIGAAARAMKVMGLGNMHLVTPKTYPSAQATAMASGADDLLASAKVHESLDSALDGCGLVLGTSARLRSLSMPQMDVRAAAVKAMSEAQGQKVAVLFGRERYGLTNEEIQRCHYLLHIPSNPEYSSLNLAQAVQVVAYEFKLAAMDEAPQLLEPLDYQPAPAQETEGFLEHLERTLLATGFLNPKQPKRLMARLRRLYLRARPDQNEINILRGILSSTERALDERGSEE